MRVEVNEDVSLTRSGQEERGWWWGDVEHLPELSRARCSFRSSRGGRGRGVWRHSRSPESQIIITFPCRYCITIILKWNMLTCALMMNKNKLLFIYFIYFFAHRGEKMGNDVYSNNKCFTKEYIFIKTIWKCWFYCMFVVWDISDCYVCSLTCDARARGLTCENRCALNHFTECLII